MTYDKKVFSYGLLAMVLTHALVHAAGNMRGTLFPLLKEEFILSNQQIGIITAIPPLVQTLLSIPAGMMSDRFGAKKLVALSIVMAAVGSLIAGFTNNVLMYIVATTLMTLNSTFYHPPSHSYVTRSVETRDRAKALGFLNAGGTFGIAIGPLSITILMGYFMFQWRQVYLFWVIPILLGLVVLYFVKDLPKVEDSDDVPDDDVIEEEAASLLSRDMIMYLLSSGVRMFAMFMVGTFLSIYLVENRGWDAASLGVMFGASSVLGIFASPLGGVIASRLGEKKWAVISLGASYIFFFAGFFTKGVLPFLAMYLTYRFLGILGMPATASITAKLSPPKQRGMGFALSFLPSSISGIVAPMVAAYVADYWGYFPVFMIASGILVIGILILQFGVKIK